MRHRSLAGEGVDEFDPKRPTYILVTPSRHVVGFACLLPATGPTMILVLFPDLERTGPAAPSCSDGRKFSLLRLYLAGSGEGRGVAAHHVTLAMFVTIIEWSNGRMVDQRLSRNRHGHRCPFRANSQACRLAHDPTRRSALAREHDGSGWLVAGRSRQLRAVTAQRAWGPHPPNQSRRLTKISPRCAISDKDLLDTSYAVFFGFAHRPDEDHRRQLSRH
jgi:hypothetical protein